VSTPAEEQRLQAQQQERAAMLADSTVNALTAARTSLGFAAETADEVDQVLRRSENDIVELGAQVNRIRYAGDEPQRTAEDVAVEVRRQFGNAQELAGDVDRRLRAGASGLQNTQDHLEQSARAIAAGRQFVGELEQLPGQQNARVAQLRDRLATLDRAVHGAMEGVDRTGAQLTAARRNLEPVLEGRAYTDDPARTAAVVNEASSTVDQDVLNARNSIRGLREDFDTTRPDVNAAARDSDELATAIRAGTNPTPRAQQTASAAQPEDPRRAWSEGRDLGHDLNR
jgi:predicted  nucleic acid-binding Zn-ribbon protein